MMTNKPSVQSLGPLIYVIGGPTASGKSSYALELAAKHDGVILNADSMQVYDGLHTLTAHPDAQDQKQAPHEFYGYLHPNAPCSAGNWRESVMPRIEELIAQGKTPIVVGGSGLYLNALMQGLSPIPDIPENIRTAAVREQEKLGNPGFYEALKKRDPVMAERFHPYHTARLIRAWEVLEATGKSLSEWQEIPRAGPPAYWQFDVTLVMPVRDTLYERCNQRFDWMVENGVLEEVEGFFKKVEAEEIKPDVPLVKALGARVLWQYLQGSLSKEEAIERGKAETRQYAKRQTTWFRHQVKEDGQIQAVRVKT
ncbi:MAG: tRNA (adenosine(37)-N6)-dimethylallyltransferase MiaA [Alphaproteobacteria bacterium]|nr:tRNA (adenosine(37)-N6)-dimethylallyltransferase MiaA [Alphaproteobacteria bacterium]